MDCWMDKKNEKKMDGWMDKKYMKNIWMVDGQKKEDGGLDEQKKIYEKNMEGWMD